MLHRIEHGLPLPPGPPVLALGAWFKNTVCAASATQAFLSYTVGDLDSPEACRAHEDTARALLTGLQQQTGQQPQGIAHDLHPDFYSSRLAATLAQEMGLPLLAVQHHHAHIAAICAEHGWQGPVLGLALDGVGWGHDGTAWGGELLQVHGSHCQRLGHLHPLALPGGDRAAQEPWRMAAAALHALGRGRDIPVRFAQHSAAAGVVQLLVRGVRCPASSSMGRLFDAAAGLLGLCHVMHTEAEAAIALEQAAKAYGPCAPLAQGWLLQANGQLSLLPLLAALADEPDAGRGAAYFHATVAAALCAWLEQAIASTGITTVALGGGCWFNQYLLTAMRQHCAARGWRCLEAQTLRPGDSAIALGQTWVARAGLQDYPKG
ncbi:MULTISPECIES: Kae1-like domain-containing protein [Giesbergeria]|uniref:Carbamoyltransferase HypF n=1 Tax=Giesbergeria sinuosa TaxID=80883 RepID=A0ABV9Q9A5_9BURK